MFDYICRWRDYKPQHLPCFPCTVYCRSVHHFVNCGQHDESYVSPLRNIECATSSVSPLLWSFSTTHVQIRPSFSLQAFPAVKLSRLKGGGIHLALDMDVEDEQLYPLLYLQQLIYCSRKVLITCCHDMRKRVKAESLSTTQSTQCCPVWGPDSSGPGVHHVNCLGLRVSLPRNKTHI